MRDNSNNKGINDEPPALVVYFTNVILLLGSSFCLFILILSIYRIIFPLGGRLFFLVLATLGLVGIVLFLLALKLKMNLRANISLLTFSVLISLYFFEVVYEIIIRPKSTIEIITDYKRSGLNVYPNILPSSFINESFETDNTSIWPLGGGLSNVVYLMRDNFSFKTYLSDEYGFNNPKGLYNENNVDIVLLGDSFVEGYCVKNTQNISAHLRKRGFNVLNLGKGGNGPFCQYISLVEYAKPVSPNIVFWFYFEENDLKDLIGKENSQIFSLYINSIGYSQDLISKQDRINDFLQIWIDDRLQSKISENKKKVLLMKNLKLFNLRNLLNVRAKPVKQRIPEETFHIFRNILDRSDKVVSNWGGELYFVYLPCWNRYYYNDSELYNRDNVLQIVSDLNIPVIDIHEVFIRATDVYEYFPNRLSSHYNAYWYQVVGEAISDYLSKVIIIQ